MPHWVWPDEVAAGKVQRLAIGQREATGIRHLEEQLHKLRVRFLDLVKEPAPFGRADVRVTQAAAISLSVAQQCHQTLQGCERAAVEADESVFTEEIAGEHLCRLGPPDTSSPSKEERAATAALRNGVELAAEHGFSQPLNYFRLAFDVRCQLRQELPQNFE